MGRAFVERIARLLHFLQDNDLAGEFGHLLLSRTEVCLNSQQNGVHLFQFVLQMSDRHFEVDQSFFGIGCGHARDLCIDHSFKHIEHDSRRLILLYGTHTLIVTR